MNRQELNNAISEHAIWKYHLGTLVQSGKTGMTSGKFKDSECAFGKWLCGSDVVAEQKCSEHYRKVRELHADFHRVAVNVAELAAKGDKTEAEESLQFGGEFTTVSSRLVEAMIKWRDSI